MVKRFAFPVVAIVVAVIILAMQLNGWWDTNELVRASGAALIGLVLAWLAIRTTRHEQQGAGHLSMPFDGMRAQVNIPMASTDFGALQLGVAQALKAALERKGAKIVSGPNTNSKELDATIEIGAMEQEATVQPGHSGNRLAERRLSVMVRLLKPEAMSGEARLVTVSIAQMGVTDRSKAMLFAETIVNRMEARRGPGNAWIIGWT